MVAINNGSQKRRADLDAAAGAIAGCISRFVVGPLDVLKIRFQVQIEPIAESCSAVLPGQLTSKYTGMRQALVTIFKEEGVKGLWRGTLPAQLLTIPYTATQFVALQQVKSLAYQNGLMTKELAPIMSFVSGALAGATATVASYPFDLLRTTLAAQGEPKVYRSMTDAASSIVRSRGFFGLYTGLGTTLIEIIPYAALQFGCYDAFTAALRSQKQAGRQNEGAPERGGEGLTMWEQFTCGLVAGTIAKLGTHPLDVAKKRFQVAGLQRSTKYGARVTQEAVRSLPACLAQIYRKEGWKGLYKGSAPSIIKAAPAAAITFTAYEFILAYLMRIAAETPK